MPNAATQRKTQNACLIDILRMLFLPEVVVSLRCTRPLDNDRRFHALLSIDGLRFFAGKKEAGEKSAQFRPCHLALLILTKKRSWTILPQFRSRHQRIIGVPLLFLTLAKGSPWTSLSKKA
ncbi:MAG: hypothetical protein ACYC6S_03045 [Desulfobulbia bacterium]